MAQEFRLPGGGHIDRSQAVSFAFDGKSLTGHPGDTLASALLANGVRLMGRSFKYHRPRGVFSAGVEEPNALMEIGEGAGRTPNERATVQELYQGLTARSQNRFPSLAFDIMGVNDWIAPFLTAGFYYKTFMWPASFWEKVYEPIIRRAAGLGALSGEPDTGSYDRGHRHCDVLVVGSGPSGLIAAKACADAGASVILAEQDFVAGGRLLSDQLTIDDTAGSDWAAQMLEALGQMANVRIMTRTTVFGQFDHGQYGALERVTDHLSSPAAHLPREILWRIRAKRVVLAAGALERPIAFGNNDRPGVMLAGAMRTYAGRFGVSTGKSVAIFTSHDDGWQTAHDLATTGVSVQAIIDPRGAEDRTAPDGAKVFQDVVTDTHGKLGLSAVSLGKGTRLEVDCLGVSGGWNPNVHLTCHKRGRPVWDDALAGFVPGETEADGMVVAGAAAGHFSTARCLASGLDAARRSLSALGLTSEVSSVPEAEDAPVRLEKLFHVPSGKNRAWVDFQNDVTVKDIKLSHQEGFVSVEHLKRYTTLGMATDQGKLSNVVGLAVMADVTGQTIPETGTTIFRPPYTPVSIGAFAGRSRGQSFRPVRKTPSHTWAEEQGAVFVEVGAWLRAQWFPKPGETHWRQSVDREVRATRGSVGVCDVTTLGKIDIQGSDAAAFLNHVYANAFGKLAVGKVRYGLMLREDGMVMDDGTTARFADDHFVMTTTTANAGPVFRHLEFCRQCLWPDMDVQLVSTTEQWAQFAVAGPNSRKLLEDIVDAPFDISNEAFPFMACADLKVCGGIDARLFRISFSGELAYEIAVPTRYGDAMMRALMEAGAPYDVTAYGTEALGVMRVEKGHAAGNELNGTTTAFNLGLDRMVSNKKDCIGKVLSQREGLVQDDGLRLVGFKPVDPGESFGAGAHFIAKDQEVTAANDEGYMTSVAYSPTLETMIGLGFIQRGFDRFGEVVSAADPVRGSHVDVEICSPHFVDPEGARLRG